LGMKRSSREADLPSPASAAVIRISRNPVEIRTGCHVNMSETLPARSLVCNVHGRMVVSH